MELSKHVIDMVSDLMPEPIAYFQLTSTLSVPCRLGYPGRHKHSNRKELHTSTAKRNCVNPATYLTART